MDCRRSRLEQQKPSGWNWLFQVGTDAGPEILSLAGLDRDCLRSAKMARVEAVLLVSGGAVLRTPIATLATLADHAEAKRLLDQLNAAYDKSGSPSGSSGWRPAINC